MKRDSLRLMKILAIDTSTEACSAALCIDENVIFRYEIAPRKHTQLILPMIDQLMEETGLNPTQLDCLAFGRGPGAFTGVRIATGIIQGIAFGADLPVAPISSLAALAQGCWREHGSKKVTSAIDARMNEIYWGHFQLDESVMSLYSEEAVSNADQISLPEGEGWFGAGSGWDAYEEQLSARLEHHVSKTNPSAYPHARDIIDLAKHAYQNDQLVSAENVQPIYLRDNVTS